jgi:hypothetical protein
MLFRRFFSDLARSGAAVKQRQGELQRIVLVLMRSSIGRHLEVFRELIELVAGGLAEIGYSSVTMINEFAPAHRHIVFCPHLLRAQDVQRVPASTILYNFEPLDPPVFDSVGTFLADYAPRFRVWDYSAANVQYLRRLGCQAQHVPVGYAPLLSRIARPPEQDIDVLFYGDISPRRAHILDRLRQTGVNVVVVSDLYGGERDALIARAKVVLNIHNHDEIKALETPRVFYLLANRKAVVTEVNEDVEIEPDLRSAMALSSYELLVQTCVDLIADEQRRAMLEERGFACMKARVEARILASALREVP